MKVVGIKVSASSRFMRLKFLATKKIFLGKHWLSTQVGYRPRRSLLYVPGTDDKKMQKAASLNADVVVLDCEDGVALPMKVECRNSIQKHLPLLQFDSTELAIRINSVDTEYATDDIEAVFDSECLPDAVMIPKIETIDHVKLFKMTVSTVLAQNRKSSLKKTIKVIGQIETPCGMMNLRDIMEEASEQHNTLKFEAFVFGSDDYLASIGARRTIDAIELLFARQYFIMHVRGYGFQAVDMVDINFRDLKGLKKQSEEGVRMGFTGKQVIHPAQIDVVNQAFSPTKEQIEYAEGLVEAFDAHQKSGKGAFTYRDSMIDMPSVKQAQNVLNLAKATT